MDGTDVLQINDAATITQEWSMVSCCAYTTPNLCS